jgi:hypothetical protein
MLAARSGQGHVRAGKGLPTPCRREHGLHVSQSRLDRASWRYSQREVIQAAVVPDPNDCPPCPFGDMPSLDGPGSSPGKVVGARGKVAAAVAAGRKVAVLERARTRISRARARATDDQVRKEVSR